MKKNINRRLFVKRAIAAGAAVGFSNSVLAAVNPTKSGHSPKQSIKNYRPGISYREVGKTGIYVSTFSLGSGKTNSGVLKTGLDMGLNLIHTSTAYMMGRGIKLTAKAIANQKDNVHIALKDNFDDIETALKTLGVKHVDFIMFNRHNAKKFKAELPKIKRQFLSWRDKGLVKFAGLTCHKQMGACLDVAINAGFFSCVMPTLAPEVFQSLKKRREKLAEANIGILAMKTKGELNAKAYQGQIQTVLADTNVASIIKGGKSIDELKTWADAANRVKTGWFKRLSPSSPDVVYQGCTLCGECEEHCPRSVPVADIVRCTRYYNEAENSPDIAAEMFAEHRCAQGLSNCDSCGLCEKFCPQQIPVLKEIRKAKKLWTNQGMA